MVWPKHCRSYYSDIRMPGMDGYQLVRNLRSNARTRLVPIIFLTAKDETADRIQGFRTGVDAYITKPFEPEELAAVVAGILQRVESMHSDLALMFGKAEPEVRSFIRDEELTDAEGAWPKPSPAALSNKRSRLNST